MGNVDRAPGRLARIRQSIRMRSFRRWTVADHAEASLLVDTVGKTLTAMADGPDERWREEVKRRALAEHRKQTKQTERP